MKRFILFCVLSIFSFVDVGYCQLSLQQHLDSLTIDPPSEELEGKIVYKSQGQPLTIGSNFETLEGWQQLVSICKSTYLRLRSPDEDLNQLLDLLNSDEISEKSLPNKYALTFAPYNYFESLIDCINALYDVNERLIEYYEEDLAEEDQSEIGTNKTIPAR